MSIFSGLQSGGIRGPDVVINGDGGSLLPSSASGVRFSSAKINQTSALLSGIKPYSYGAGSTSDDISYGVVPHKIQKIVPQFSLPSDKNDIGGHSFIISHGVDDGDVAFTIRLEHDKAKRIKNWNFFSKQNITRAVDQIVNICTVNYILRGLQTWMGDNDENWNDFLQATGWPVELDTFKLENFRDGVYQHRNVSMFIQDYIRPLGIVIGSENQGGQHQPGGAVDFPVDFVVTILVDGLCDNMLNLWKRTEIRAGDDLFFALCGSTMQNKKLHTDSKPVPFQFSDKANSGLIKTSNFVFPQQETEYVLNHWTQGRVSTRFTHTEAPTSHRRKTNYLFELVPTTSSEIDEGIFLSDDRRNRGLWHIGRSQVHIRGGSVCPSSVNQTFRQDTANLMGGGLVQATIAPVWKAAARSHFAKHGEDHMPAYGHGDDFPYMPATEEEIESHGEDLEELEEELKEFKKDKKVQGQKSTLFPRKFLRKTQTGGACLGKRSVSEISETSSTNGVTTIPTTMQSTPVDVTTALDMDMSVLEQSVIPRSKKATPKTRTIRSLMEAPNSVDTRGAMDVDMMQEGTQNKSLTTKTSVQMESDPMEVVGSVGVGKVYARSVTTATAEGVSRPIAVARVSTKKRVEASE